MTAYNTDAFLVEITIADPSKSCYYMDLGNIAPYAAFSIQYATYSDAYVFDTKGIGANTYLSTLYKLDLFSKTISAPICIYPFEINGAASVYSYLPSIADSFACSSLPIHLLNFSYTILNQTVNLHWQTTTEINSSYFLIERSADGTNFTPIGKEVAAGNSNSLKQYSFTDNNPGSVNYYRLKEVDKDGYYTYSHILLAKLQQAQPFIIMGNPVQTNLQVQINTAPSQINQLSIFDFMGGRLRSFNVQNGVQNIDVSFLTTGNYILQLITGDGQVYNKVFVKGR